MGTEDVRGLGHRRLATVAWMIATVALAGCVVDSVDDPSLKKSRRGQDSAEEETGSPERGASASGDPSSDGSSGSYGFLPGTAKFRKRLTGADLDTAQRWRVAGTDLGIPYVLENGSIGYLFGDTFGSAWPEEGNDWRSPVMLRSNVHPNAPGGIVFDSAAKVAGNGRAPELFFNAHDTRKVWGNPPSEFTAIPNDGISFPETKRQIISFMSVNHWDPNGLAMWRTGYAGLAYSDNGNDFVRLKDPIWPNNEANTDPFQMWTMQRDGEWVYVYSVRAGRQFGPMMLRRVHWTKMFYKEEYQCWGKNGADWGWGPTCTPLFEGFIGEPSVRRLSDGTWAMTYLNTVIGSIVSRKATRPEGPWSNEKIQLTTLEEPALYGGFIHPWSTSKPNDLHMMVSKWTRGPDGRSTAYHVSHYVGTL